MEIQFLQHDVKGNFRVRRSDWPSDTFEIVNFIMLEQIQNVCVLLGIPFVELEE